MAQPVWVTPAGDLGTIAENLFFQLSVEASDPDGGTPTYSLIAGNLPEGVQVLTNGTVEGVPLAYVRVQGTPTEVSENVTSTFAIRATSPDGLSINDRTFSLTVTGQDIPQFTTPAGSLGNFFDCDNVNVTIGFTDSDTNDTVTISVDNGSLPPGLTLNPTTGLISGHISAISNLPDDATAGYDASAFDLYPFDFSQRSINKNYEFTLKITDGKDQNLRTFTMFVISRDSLTADTTDFTADDDVLTADLSPSRTPYITNYPPAETDPVVAAGTIGTFRHNNFFAYQILGFDCDGDAFEFEIVTGDSADLPPGISFNRTTGWLTGYFPEQGATETTYSFDITIYKANDNSVVSEPYTYIITVIGSIESSVIWSSGTLVPGTGTGTGKPAIYSLGTIANGATSMFSIVAENPSGRVLLFKLNQGADNYNLLPQGLQLLESGNIAGRVSFNTFTIDGGTTTFDKDVRTRLISAETIFDRNFDFTVVAFSSDGLVSVNRTFRITVDRAYNSPYNGLYIKAMPDNNDRSLVSSLLQDTDIFDPSRVYRADDPYFGIAKNVIYNHAFSLDTATLEEYVNALDQNHFRKKLILGEIKTAQALNTDGTVAYEVVYSDIIDTGVNKLGQSPPQSIEWPVELTIDGVDYPDRLSNDTVTSKVGLANQGIDYLEPALNANLLATVASQMSKDWAADGSPGDPAGDDPSGTFTWSPSNECDTYSDNVRYDLFKTQLEAAALANNIIYSEYYTGKEENGNVQRYIEPFAFLVEQGDHAYIVIRGTLGEGNVKLDVDAANKVDNPLGQGQIGSGWLKAFQGLGVPASASAPGYTRGSDVPGITLQQALENTTKTKLRICSHSLGSAMATLVCAYAVSLNKFEIEGLPSASPRVGNLKFRTWFDNLTDINGNKMVDRWKRLTNINDTIPTVPYIAMGFVHVGLEINFDALYLNDKGKKDTGLNHQICCCYGYALKNPTDPFNPENNGIACIFPKPRASGDLDINAHYEQLLTFYDQFLTPLDVAAVTTQTVYPNSLVNMRDRVVDTVGQTNTILPLWMTSKQTDGRVLGFTKAWVICYTNPGESDRISYNVRTQFGEILNRVDFISDRYILDNQLTANWVPNEDSTDGGNWNPSPPLTTTFNANQSVNPTSSGNETTFDGNSLRFTSPVDVYGKTDKYDKYLVFPKTNILG